MKLNSPFQILNQFKNFDLQLWEMPKPLLTAFVSSD